MTITFPGKKSRSFGIFLLIIGIFLFGICFVLPFILNDKADLNFLFVSGIILTPVLSFFIWTWLNTRYLIQNNTTLKIIHGPFVWSVPIHEIRFIRLAQKTIGGTFKFTLSWQSMEIRYKKYRSVFISPQREEEFIELLKKLNPSIELR